MNREIRFRAWYIEEKRMEYQDNKTPDWVGDILTNKTFYIPLQYTGLKDRHGKEIYEGDLVIAKTSFEDSNDEYEWTKEKACEVSYDPDFCGFLPFVLNCRRRCDVIDVEIIGNIYEKTI